MKKLFLAIAVILLAFSCSIQQKSDETQKNKEISALYHKLNSNDIDSILTDNFIGRTGKDLHTWNREDHRGYLTNGSFKKDSVFSQIAEGDLVATRFIRTGEYEGDTVKVEIMQFKRFENGKIAEIWEYWDHGMIKEMEDRAEAEKPE